MISVLNNPKKKDIGALDSVKETLKELVMLPLQRPELFRKGNLTKPTKVHLN
jgi:SpoVK/Ycf46/Vps4 family AAA+-type ATPase